ncbi:MAG: hypothetical protein ABI674_08275 [Spartobacteria bacterium]
MRTKKEHATGEQREVYSQDASLPGHSRADELFVFLPARPTPANRRARRAAPEFFSLAVPSA